MIKDYKVLVTKTIVMDISMDTDKFNEEFLKDYSEYFSEVDSVDDIVRNLAYQVANGETDFIEGVGKCKKWNEDEEQHFSKEGFSVEQNYEDTEVEIESISTRSA